MWLDDFHFTMDAGWTAGVHGGMFSGKTEELVDRLIRAEKYIHLKVQAFKFRGDDRYSENFIVSHGQNKFPATKVYDSAEILAKLEPDVQVIGIDEVQFLDDGIIEVCRELHSRNLKTIYTALGTDFRAKPFMFRDSKKNVFDLIADSYPVISKAAICHRCHKPGAIYTERLVKSEALVVIGGPEAYGAACQSCHPYTRKENRLVD
jgi:thymidine kinase